MKFRPVGILACLVAALSATGCSSTTTSNTARTAKEQLLLSNAVDQSLDKVDFTPLYSQRVFLEEKYLECVDKNYVLGSIRHRILRAGGVLTASADDADVVMEIRSGGVGTDTSESFVGTPELVLPGMMTLPEVRFVERRTQFGYSKLGIVTYDAKTRQVLGDGGLSMAQADDSNWFALGLGPFQNGSLKGEVGRAQMVPPGTHRRQLPSMVALQARQPSADQVRFASEQKVSPETGTSTIPNTNPEPAIPAPGGIGN